MKRIDPREIEGLDAAISDAVDALPATTAADVTVDDSGFTQLTGTTVQDVLDNLDASGTGGTPTRIYVPLSEMVGGVPTLVFDSNGQVVMTEVPL